MRSGYDDQEAFKCPPTPAALARAMDASRILNLSLQNLETFPRACSVHYCIHLHRKISEGTDQISVSMNANEKLQRNTGSGITSLRSTGLLQRSTPKVKYRCVYKCI